MKKIYTAIKQATAASNEALQWKEVESIHMNNQSLSPTWVPRSSTTPQIQQAQGQSSSRTYHFWLQLCGKGVLKLIVSLLQQYKRTQTDTHQRCQAHAADPDLYVAQTLLEVNRKRLTCNLIHIDYHLIQVGMDWLMTYRLQFIPKIELKFREIVVTWIFTTASLHAGWHCR